MVIDAAYLETERKLWRMEQEIKAEYLKASVQVQKKLNDYVSGFATRDAAMQAKVAAGKMTEQAYKQWRVGQVATGQRWTELRNELATDYSNADKIARSITSGYLPEVYASNYNFATYQLEHAAKVNTSFTLYNRQAVERLARENPQLLPKPSAKTLARIKSGAITEYNAKSLQSAIMQGLLQGESIPNLAKRVAADVGEKNYNSAVRNARTMVTSTQNGGRVDAIKRLDDMGVKSQKVWLATHDDRTRHTHRILDYEAVDVDAKFSNGLEFPADPSGDPSEVYNCRCSMRSQFKGLEPQARKYMDNTVGDQTYEEWKEEHAEPQQAASELHTTATAEYDYLMNNSGLTNIEHKTVADLTAELTENEIINKIGGPDLTDGSCASLALSYCANKSGLDVTDFRGGQSRFFMSRRYNSKQVYKLANANITVHDLKKESADTAKILQGLPLNKEYALHVGHHAAIVKNTADGVQYLELQGYVNGWVPMGKTQGAVADMLHTRFDCTKTSKYTKQAMLVEVDSMQKTSEFKNVMGYINTATDKQKKGAGGYAK